MGESSQNLLLIFTRNPELGKVKTRLAKTVGEQAALDIYLFLLQHTARLTQSVQADVRVYYSDYIGQNDVWTLSGFKKHLQVGQDLGARMKNAFQEGFTSGYHRICIIGSDLYDITTMDIDRAFKLLMYTEAVIGPAEDGGYYLLGLTRPMDELFTGKTWGSESVFADTVSHFKPLTYSILPERNDIDFYEDLKDIEVFKPFLKDLDL